MSCYQSCYSDIERKWSERDIAQSCTLTGSTEHTLNYNVTKIFLRIGWLVGCLVFMAYQPL